MDYKLAIYSITITVKIEAFIQWLVLMDLSLSCIFSKKANYNNLKKLDGCRLKLVYYVRAEFVLMFAVNKAVTVVKFCLYSLFRLLADC